MDFLRQQLVLIQERLRGLTPSQKLLAAALVVIVVMTMLYSGRYASNSDTVALFSNTANPAELAAVTSALSNNSITYTIVAGTVRVPTDRQEEAIAAIATAANLTAGGNDALESMLDKFSPLATSNEFNARIQNVRNRTLASTIQGWPGVKSARVMVTESVRGALVPAPAGASVDIQASTDVNARKLAKAALSMVLPTVPYLKPENITVLVNGDSVLSSGEAGGFDSSDLMASKHAYESSIEQDIRDVYRIDGMRVSVTADVTNETKHEQVTTPDAQHKVSMPTESLAEKTSTTDAAPPAEPGAVPNMSLDASAGLASRGGSKTEKTEDHFQNTVGMTVADISTPAGKPKIVSAVVRVPRSYIVKAWKAWNKKDPDETEVAGLVKSELEKMRLQLVAKTMLTDPGVLVVDDYLDFDNSSDMMVASAAASAPGSIAALAGAHGKEAAIGALALTSLFMVSRMVKKSAPPPMQPMTLDDMPNLSSSKPTRRAGPLGGLDIAGEVAESGSVMMGQELDEEVLETSQMVEQVTGFVKENPDTTAQLLKRWMSRE